MGKKTKMSLKERLAEQRENLNNRGGGYDTFIFPKPGVYRMRHVPVGEENDFAMECIQFYLSKELGSVISPKTFGEKCAIYEAFEELSNSKNEKDRDFAKKLKPKKVYLSPVFKYKDEKGKEIDTQNGVKLVVLKGDQYQTTIDLFLDDEQGDFTHPKKGYDIKYRREGTGQFDTKYTAMACPKNGNATPKEYRGPYNVEEMVKAIIPSYKETKKLVEKFLNLDFDDDGDEKPKKKDKDKKKKKKRDL